MSENEKVTKNEKRVDGDGVTYYKFNTIKKTDVFEPKPIKKNVQE